MRIYKKEEIRPWAPMASKGGNLDVESTDFKRIKGGNLDVESTDFKKYVLTDKLTELGAVQAGPIWISIGSLCIVLKHLWPWGDTDRIFTGSLQKYGSVTSLVAHMDHQTTFTWEVRLEIGPQDKIRDDQIPNMVRDMAFKILHDLPRDKITAKTWQGFKHFTEVLDAYLRYGITDDMDYLEQARMECLKAVKAEPDNKEVSVLLDELGMAYSNKKEYSIAEELFFLSLKTKFDDSFAFFGLGYLYILQGQYEKSLEYFEKEVEIDPQNAKAWLNRGVALYKLGRIKEAIRSYDESIQIYPKNVLALSNKGVALDKLGRIEEAINAHENAIEIDPKCALAWNNEGATLYNFNLTKKAIEAFEKAIEIDPKYAEAWKNKGLSHDKLGQIKESIKAYKKAADLGLEFVELYISIARLYRKLCKEAESAEACKLARDLIEKEHEYNRACFEAVCGSLDAALDLLRTALEKKQAPPDWARQDPDFEFIRDDPRFKVLLDEFSEDEKKGPE